MDSRVDVGRERSRIRRARRVVAGIDLGPAPSLSVGRIVQPSPVESDVSNAAAPGTLYVVSTPIGNMGDFSFRAVEVLRSVNGILAEDTRHTRGLLERYEIDTPMVAYHEHNEAKTTPGLVARLAAGGWRAPVCAAGERHSC